MRRAFAGADRLRVGEPAGRGDDRVRILGGAVEHELAVGLVVGAVIAPAEEGVRAAPCSEKEPPTMIAGTPRRASAQPSWRWTKAAASSSGSIRRPMSTMVESTSRSSAGLPAAHHRDRLAGRVDGDRVHVDRGDDRGERHGRMFGEIAGAEQAHLLRGGRHEQDVARRARRRREAAGNLDQAGDAARIVDGAVADPVGLARGPAQAEMVPMGEQQQAFAGRAGCRAAGRSRCSCPGASPRSSRPSTRAGR